MTTTLNVRDPAPLQPLGPPIRDPDPAVPVQDEPDAPPLSASGQNLADDNDMLSDEDDFPEDRSQGTRSDLTLEESKRLTPNPLPARPLK